MKLNINNTGKVICVGRNFVKHIEELNNEFPEEMVLFQKSASTVTDRLIKPVDSCRFEGEISLRIENKKVQAVGAGLDLTLDEKQNYLKSKGLPWERAKSFKHAAVFTEFVPFEGRLEDLSLELYLNGSLQQHAKPEKMIYSFDTILQQSEAVFGLDDGDVIMSGTPEGVAAFKVGDAVQLILRYCDTILVDTTLIAQKF